MNMVQGTYEGVTILSVIVYQSYFNPPSWRWTSLSHIYDSIKVPHHCPSSDKVRLYNHYIEFGTRKQDEYFGAAILLIARSTRKVATPTLKDSIIIQRRKYVRNSFRKSLHKYTRTHGGNTLVPTNLKSWHIRRIPFSSRENVAILREWISSNTYIYPPPQSGGQNVLLHLLSYSEGPRVAINDWVSIFRAPQVYSWYGERAEDFDKMPSEIFVGNWSFLSRDIKTSWFGWKLQELHRFSIREWQSWGIT